MTNEIYPEEELPPMTAPDSFPVRLSGFGSQAQAEQFGNTIGSTIRTISRYINLERLDGVTVAHDYDEALSQFNRGYPATRPLTRTSDDNVVGVAMAPAVLREGRVKAHLVFYAPCVMGLENPHGEHFSMALYLVAHECAHVEDLKYRDENFPGMILQQRVTDCEEAVLEVVAIGLWEEYAACRISARFARDRTGMLEDNFVSSVPVAKEKAQSAIKSYRLHADVDRVLEEAGRPLCEPLRMGAYLLGHLHGTESDLNEMRRACDVLAGSPYDTFIERLSHILEDLWSRRGAWVSRDEFTPLYDLARDTLAEGGLFLQRLADGRLYVDIPFTSETMP